MLDGTAVVAISFNEGELWVIFRDWHFINHYYSCSQKNFYHMSKIYLCSKSHNPEGLQGWWKVGKETRKKLCFNRGRFGNVTSILSSSLSLTYSLGKTPSELIYSIFKVKEALTSHQSPRRDPRVQAEEACFTFP